MYTYKIFLKEKGKTEYTGMKVNSVKKITCKQALQIFAARMNMFNIKGFYAEIEL